MALFLRQKRTMFPINPLRAKPFREPSMPLMAKGQTRSRVLRLTGQKKTAAPSQGGGVGPPLLALDSRVTFMGESITAFYGPHSIREYHSKGVFRSMATDNFGVSGNSSAQMVTRFPNIPPLKPKVVVIFGGTNDIPGQSAQYTIDSLANMYAQTRASGAVIVAVTVLPRSSFGSAEQVKRATINAWIDTQAASDLRVVEVIGFAHAIHTYDGTHPNTLAAKLVGSFLGPAIASYFLTDDILLTTDGQLIPVASRRMAGTTGTHVATSMPSTGQVATGFTLNNGTTLDVVASKSTLRGRAAQQIDISGNADATGTIQLALSLSSLRLTAGDFREYIADVQTQSMSGVYAVSVAARGGQWSSSFGTSTEGWPGDIDGTMRSFPEAYAGDTSTASVFFTIAVMAGQASASFKIAAPLAR